MGIQKKKIDLSGQVFGRLVVVVDTQKRENGYVIWLCTCNCGKTVEVSSNSLRMGRTRSCGCYNRDVTAARNMTHGDSVRGNTKALYRTWHHMLERCKNSNDKSFVWYGGKGVRVCQAWKEYINFKKWAESIL